MPNRLPFAGPGPDQTRERLHRDPKDHHQPIFCRIASPNLRKLQNLYSSQAPVVQVTDGSTTDDVDVAPNTGIRTRLAEITIPSPPLAGNVGLTRNMKQEKPLLRGRPP